MYFYDVKKKTKVYLTYLLPIQIVVVKVLSYFPEIIEYYYSNGFYQYSSKALRFVFGVLPFSVGDIGYVCLIGLLIRFIVKSIKNKNWKSIGLDITSTISIVYACFHIFWGFNYYRQPLHKVLQIEDEYTTEELIKVTEVLVAKANKYHKEIAVHDTLAVVFPYTKSTIFEETPRVYQNLSKTYPELTYRPKSVKKSLLSLPLTYMGFSGYLNPITNEAQVNGLILDYKSPTTICHEEAHQLGFAKENEANFIAAIATMQYDDIYYKYSGTTFALKFCLNDLYFRDEEKAICLLEKLNLGIRKNYWEVTAFWEQYQNPLEPIFKSTYDSYLKANNQPKGIETYSYVVALLVNYLK